MLSSELVSQAEEVARAEAERFKKDGLVGINQCQRALAVGRLIMAHIEVFLYESGLETGEVEMFDAPQAAFMAMLRAGYDMC